MLDFRVWDSHLLVHPLVSNHTSASALGYETRILVVFGLALSLAGGIGAISSVHADALLT